MGEEQGSATSAERGLRNHKMVLPRGSAPGMSGWVYQLPMAV